MFKFHCTCRAQNEKTIGDYAVVDLLVMVRSVTPQNKQKKCLFDQSISEIFDLFLNIISLKAM